jgi:hypothetical protein
MTKKNDFSQEEWKLLLEAPLYAGIAVMAADMNITGLLKEGESMVQAVDNLALPETATPFLRELINEIRDSFESAVEIPAEIDTVNPDAQQKSELDALQEVGSLADSRMEPDEANEFKNWLGGIARQVASAAREGGFWGIGGEQVSSDEQTALQRIKESLNIQES